jgi:hypothetical protein
MDLVSLIEDPATPIERIAEHLDTLPPAERRAECLALGRSPQRKLWNKAKASPPIGLADFVPESVAARTPVRHFGRNTLPLPGPFRLFEKRFCRPDAGGERLFGFNEGITRPYLGPGYFVAVPTRGNREWEERGPIVVDYFQVPDAPVADGWPPVVPNDQGLQVLVFNKTRDFMRKVSRHVSIGAAHKVEKPLDHYFVLVREE